MSDKKCNYCGENISEDYKEKMPDGTEKHFCSAKCARDKYRIELANHGD